VDGGAVAAGSDAVALDVDAPLDEQFTTQHINALAIRT
jgi:hypothetical protein